MSICISSGDRDSLNVSTWISRTMVSCIQYHGGCWCPSDASGRCLWKESYSRRTPFTNMDILNPGMDDHIPSKARGVSILKLQRLQLATAEIRNRMNNFITCFMMEVITYPWWYLNWSVLVKMSPDVSVWKCISCVIVELHEFIKQNNI